MGKALPKLLITSQNKKEYPLRDGYLCTVDREHRHTHEFKGDNGETFTLFLPKDKSNDHREKHPNIGKVESKTNGAQFEVGDELLCKHFTFEQEDNTPKVFYEEDGVEYYRVFNRDVMFAIRGEELIPREGILLCEPIKDKLYESTLELAPVDVDYRRDVVKVLKVWDGCEEYKPGDFIMLAKGGDYPFTHKGKEYVKVDHYFGDVIAIVGDSNHRIKEIRRRVRDHSKQHTPV